MKHFFTLLLMSFAAAAFAQGNFIKGTVLSGETDIPMVAIQVEVNGSKFLTNDKGIFSIPTEIVSEGTQVHILQDGYYQVDALLEDNMVIKLFAETDEASTIALSLTDLDMDDDDSQSTPGLLFSSGDAYSSIAGFAWGPYWFRQRGYNSSYMKVYFDGIDMASPERGYASWSLWGGLNDVIRNKEVTTSTQPIDFDFGDVGGSTNILSDPSSQKPGYKAVYSLGNGNYNHRLMLTYSTGLLDNGWAFTVSGSRRWAQESYAEGTFYDAWAGFVSAEKRFSDKHKMVFTAFVAPRTVGQQMATTKEAYELKGTNYYNPTWGWQDGKKRNSRQKSQINPQFIVKDTWKISDKLTLRTSAGYQMGKEKRTALNWYDAPDPRPDYYRYMPSFFYNEGTDAGDLIGDRVTELWQNGTFGQVNWDHMYNVNRNSPSTVPVDWRNPDGEQYSGSRSHYIIEGRHNDYHRIDVNPTLMFKPTETLDIITGVQLQYYQSNNYNTVEDLLGGDFWLDIDNFADRDFVEREKSINNLNDSTWIRGQGDRIGHDYTAHIQTAGWWGQVKKSFKKGSVYVGGNVTHTSMYRDSHRRKGLFPDNSFGKSEVLSFLDFGVKAGGEYFLNGRNVLTVNGTAYTKAPYFMDSFLSLRTRNETVDGLTSSKVLSGDVNYYYRGERFKVRATGFYTQISDLSKVISYFDDGHNAFMNYALTGMGQTHTGIELGASYNITDELRLRGAATYASYLYSANPRATATVDNNSEVLIENEKVFFNGRHVGGSPEIAGTIGLEYWSKDYWNVGFQVNFLGDRYVTLNPVRYTDRAVEGVDKGTDEYNEILHQEKMDDAFTVDFFAGKSWKIDNKLIRLNLNVNNALNNTNIATTGFQQYRYDFQGQNPEKFPNKYYYAQGIRAFLNLSLTF
ncbi:TonB-dependent receptor [Flammeovirga aprica]|uniref:TonB-dependent receptor n=1 Tax=Flammeovirga aprica JL-4 TaxID=694437 RepID=A0A7X9RT04_9BACT|nr:TonB-dependent receptor [Flammeovirga aprica]NME66632.1 TonB-dependent receptor [Flammeovirga aprica JL-4]